jgi:hypothetical protein
MEQGRAAALRAWAALLLGGLRGRLLWAGCFSALVIGLLIGALLALLLGEPLGLRPSGCGRLPRWPLCSRL